MMMIIIIILIIIIIIIRGLSFAITLLHSTNELNRADCGYQVHGTERKISTYCIWMT
jgi:predicted Holliday junction resolvase-like endonuclease